MHGCTVHCGCVMGGNGVRGVLVVDFILWICTCEYAYNKRNTGAINHRWQGDTYTKQRTLEPGEGR